MDWVEIAWQGDYLVTGLRNYSRWQSLPSRTMLKLEIADEGSSEHFTLNNNYKVIIG